jgi:hypothetical protein
MSAVTAQAGTTLGVDMDVEIPQLMNMTWAVSGASVQLTGVNAITVNEFTQGFRDAIPGGTLNCDSNEDYDITVEATAANFTGGSGTKPTSELLIDVENAGTYSYNLNGTFAITIVDERTASQNDLIPLEYMIELYSDDTPGIYAADLTYTILVD